MSEQLKGLVEKMAWHVTDFDGSPMTDDEEPHRLTCGLLREVATALQSLMEEKERLHAKWNEQEAETVAYRDRYRQEAAIVDRVWSALGIETYEQAKPYAIQEHVSRLRDRLSHAEAVVRELVRLRDNKRRIGDLFDDYVANKMSDDEERQYEDMANDYNASEDAAWQSARTFLAEQDKTQQGHSGSVSARSSEAATQERDRWVTFNINDKVRVKLTDFGREKLSHRNDELNRYLRARGAKNSALLREPGVHEDADGWSEWQMWDLMNAFGPHICLGGSVPFETTIELASRALTSSQGTPQDVSPRDERISCHCFSDEARRLCLDKHRCYGPIVAVVSGESHE